MLEELFCAHRAELTAYCRGLCRSDAAAQDMVQEVFLQHQHDELHRRVVVVQQQYLVHRRRTSARPLCLQ